MDDFTVSTLKEWGFDNLVDRFKEEEIDSEAFLALTENMIAKLLPTLGKQSKFNKELIKLKEKINKEKETYSLVSSDSLGSLTDSPDLDIANLDFIIANGSNSSNPTVQTLYGTVCAEDFNVATGSQNVYTNISNTTGISSLFSSENENTYFTPYSKQGLIISPNRGKLYDKYCNLKRNILKLNNKRKSAESNDSQKHFSEDDFEDSLNWLKNNVEPENILHKLWNETAEFRLNTQKNLNVIDLYPALKKPTGHYLIDLDFGHLYPGKGMCLFQKFDLFKKKLNILLKQKPIKLESTYSQFLIKLNDPKKPGDDDLASLLLLPFMFQPTNVVLKNKKTHRPSKIEQSRAFITHIVCANELKTLHQQKKDRALFLGLTVQPYVVVIGDIDGLDPIHAYTIIDNTQYLLETPIKAVDVCFKAFHSLNLEYPIESNQVWCFIEHYFYNIVNPIKGKQFLSIQTLVKDLNSCSDLNTT
ncbi:uncharacterized protein LOC114127207 isoform X2 [Aphis gossypii]|uniref:uncharacterized protein LOC114127207 isoform X2 n=1 Tax=Aphis gossypii TaxID=80765 RepID=UPI002158F9B1|nr:uncharacterized protein LOC114127207 isoform X2 [Aphis gossypii]